MVNLNSISKRCCLELFDELKSISELITQIKETIERELRNDIDIVYDGDIRYQHCDFVNMKFKQIESLIVYMKSNSDYQKRLELDRVLDSIRDWFSNKLLQESLFLSNPPSYELATKLDSLTHDINNLDDRYFTIDKKLLWVFSKEQLKSLELIILKDLYEVKIKVNEFKKREFSGMKADSDYIKNKK